MNTFVLSSTVLECKFFNNSIANSEAINSIIANIKNLISHLIVFLPVKSNETVSSIIRLTFVIFNDDKK